MKILTLLLFLLLQITDNKAQTDTLTLFEIDPDPIIEGMEYWESIPESVEMTEETEIQTWREHNQWNINQLSADVAIQTLQMSDFQYYQLQKYIDQHGALVTIYELAGIEGFDYPDMLQFIPFLYAKPIKQNHKLFRNFFKHSKHQLIIRNGRILQSTTPEDQNDKEPLEGTPDHLCFKYRFQANDWFSFALSGEKDAGETLFKENSKHGFDLYSGYIQAQNLGILRKLVIGDFRVQWGEGVILGSDYLQGSGVLVRKMKNPIQAVSTMNESSFLRGISCEMGSSKWNTNLFYSNKMEIAENTGVMGGISSKLNFKLLRIGVHAVAIKYIDSINTNPKLYSKNLLTGVLNANFGLEHQLILGKTLLFGEYGMSLNRGFGVLQGLSYTFEPATKMVLLFRHYSSDFHSIAGNGFSKNSTLQNETGLYLAYNTSIHKNTILELFSDLYTINWVRYLIEKPTEYLDYGLRFQFQLSRSSSVVLIYKHRSNYKNRTTLYYKEISPQYSEKIKLAIKWAPFPFMIARSECQWSINRTITVDSELYGTMKHGFLIMQDLQIQFKKPKLTCITRIALFESDTYEERLYGYESDINYCFTINNYYNKGIRYYFVIKYGLSWIDFQIKFSQTIFENQKLFGYESPQEQPVKKTEIKGQCILKF